MKTKILILLTAVLFSCESKSQNTNVDDVKTAMTSYIQAGDTNNVEKLNPMLHNDYRVALYDGQKDAISILDRATYISFIEMKKFGGYKRTTVYEDIEFINDHMATVKVTLTSPGKPTLKNFYSLAKTNGTWQVIQDYVTLIP